MKTSKEDLAYKTLNLFSDDEKEMTIVHKFNDGDISLQSYVEREKGSFYPYGDPIGINKKGVQDLIEFLIEDEEEDEGEYSVMNMMVEDFSIDFMVESEDVNRYTSYLFNKAVPFKVIKEAIFAYAKHLFGDDFENIYVSSVSFDDLSNLHSKDSCWSLDEAFYAIEELLGRRAINK